MSHYRYSRLKDNWVIIAEERAQRPGLDPLSKEYSPTENSPFAYGNEHLTPPEIHALRDEGTRPDSPDWQVRVVPNKFRAVSIEDEAVVSKDGPFLSFGGFGAHEVIIDTPDPKRSPGSYTRREMADLLCVIQQRYDDLSKDPRIKYIQVFKNYGQKAGATIPHSHSQIIAIPFVPKNVDQEMAVAREYYVRSGRSLFLDDLEDEIKAGERLVFENGGFAAICPYASFFPFEIRVAPRFHCFEFSSLDSSIRDEMAEALLFVLNRLENSVQHVAYNIVFKLAPPVREHRNPDYYHHLERYYQWYIEITPRIYNFAGFEIGTGQAINPISPERCARYLREKSV